MDNKFEKWPKVNIVLPLFKQKNIPTYLVNSLQQLTYPKVKLQLTIIEIVGKTNPLKLKGITVKKIFVADKIGYGQAANIGVANSDSELILLINPDIKLEKNALNIMVDKLIKDSKTAIIGPKIYSLEKLNKISNFDLPVINFNRFLGAITPLGPRQILKLKEDINVEWISGSIMLFQKSIWQKIGRFNEKYFLYWEDADFCLKAKYKGFKIYLLSDAKAWHLGSASVGKTNIEKTYYLNRNGKYFLNSFCNFPGTIIVNIYSLLLFNVKLLRLIFQPQERQENIAFILGTIDFYLKVIGVNKHKFKN